MDARVKAIGVLGRARDEIRQAMEDHDDQYDQVSNRTHWRQVHDAYMQADVGLTGILGRIISSGKKKS